jgi:hypothetical protein
LHVVDGQHQRLARGERSERVEEASGDRMLVGTLVFMVGEQQRRLERSPLWARQFGQRLRVPLVDQIGEPDERKASLRFGWPRRENLVAALRSSLTGREPERRLADAGLTCEDRSARAVFGRAEETYQRLELCVSAE